LAAVKSLAYVKPIRLLNCGRRYARARRNAWQPYSRAMLRIHRSSIQCCRLDQHRERPLHIDNERCGIGQVTRRTWVSRHDPESNTRLEHRAGSKSREGETRPGVLEAIVEVGLLGRREGISSFAIEGEFEEENGAGDGSLIMTNETPDHVKNNTNVRGKEHTQR
jgi:hypothetical protein